MPTFGYSGARSTSVSADNPCGTQYSMNSEDGTATSIIVWCDTAIGTDDYTCAIYDSSDNLLETTDEQTVDTSGDWYTFTLNSQISLTANATYRLVAWGDSQWSSVGIAYNIGNGIYEDLGHSYNSFPNPFSEDQDLIAGGDDVMLAYCTYTELGGPSSFQGQGELRLDSESPGRLSIYNFEIG